MSLPDFVALLMLCALVVYCLSGGADFGGGLWDLLSFGKVAKAERRLISSALSPIWEANHVWLILIVTLLFTCFPKAFAAISIALHIPLTLMLIGIVMRGAAFTFRSYGNLDRPAAHRWGVVFAIASIITPIMLGASLATLSTGHIAVSASGQVEDIQSWAWCRAFPLCVGFFTLSLFALLAAVYLTDESEIPSCRMRFARVLWWPPCSPPDWPCWPICSAKGKLPTLSVVSATASGRSPCILSPQGRLLAEYGLSTGDIFA